MEISYSVNRRPANDAKSLNIGKGIGRLFVLIGAVFLLTGAVLGWFEREFLARAVQTRGLVVSLERRVGNGRDGRPIFVPTYTFVDREGKERRVTSRSGSNPPSYRVGQNVDVFYLPEKPEEAQIRGFFSHWGAAIIVGGIGAAQVAMGSLLAFVFGRKARQLEQGAPA